MGRVALMRAAAASVLVLASLGACGSGVDSDQWAGTVCDALTPWRAKIADLNARAQQQMASATTPEQTRASLLELLAGGESASEAARAVVAAAGIPDADGGDEVASQFVTALSGTRDAYARARSDLAALPAAEPSAFYEGVAAVMKKLNAEYAQSGVDTSTLNSPDLRQAFDRVDQCQ